MKLSDTRNEQILKHACILYNFLSYRSDEIPKEIDLLIGLGSADAGVADVCYNLVQQHDVKQVIFTGKGGKNSIYNGTSEAFRFLQKFCSRPNCDIDVMLEEEATNTYENIHYTKSYIKQVSAKNILFVGKPYQMRRCRAICINQLSNEIQLYFGSSMMSFEQYIMYHHENNILSTDEIIQELVDEVSHLIIGSKYHILSHAEMTNDIIDSYTYLLNHGFQNRLNDNLIELVLKRWENLDILDSMMKKEVI